MAFTPVTRRIFGFVVVSFAILSFLLIYHRSPWETLRVHTDGIRKGKTKEKPAHPPWKHKEFPEPSPPIKDNFPLAALGALPPIPSWNRPPDPHVPEKTPLLIGFTRNWRLLQQTVVSYITAGWPPGDIYVVENTGVMRSNQNGNLTLQNPFFLNYTRLTQTLGINVIRTPTLLNFAQLQNFYLSTAVENDWDGYFWSHMDVVVLPDEKRDDFKSLYMRALDEYRSSFSVAYRKKHKWAARWFHYDNLVLVNTKAYLDAGGWDTFIGFYMTDCDMHERLFMAGYEMPAAFAGDLWDVGTSLEDLALLYRHAGPNSSIKDDAKSGGDDFGHEAKLNDEGYHELWRKFDKMQRIKNENKGGRNTWQSRQEGGEGEPFYRFHQGFEESITMAVEQGKAIFYEKWGFRQCNVIENGLTLDDMWKVEKDW